MEIALIIAAFAIPLWLNVIATLAIRRDQMSERSQKLAQLILVWAVPVVGAVLVLAINRPLEKHSGKYPEEKDSYADAVTTGSSLRAAAEAVDGD